jgi:hypothetical protein
MESMRRLGMTAAVSSAVRGRDAVRWGETYSDSWIRPAADPASELSPGRQMLIEPFGHLGAAFWQRPWQGWRQRIRSLFAWRKLVTSIRVQPREFHVAKDNPVAPAVKGSVIAAAVLVAISFWRRRWRRRVV